MPLLFAATPPPPPPHPNEKKQAGSEKGGRAGRGSSTELRGPAFAKPPRGAGRGESREGAQPALQHAWRLPCTGREVLALMGRRGS